jgi:hypothetical protein
VVVVLPAPWVPLSHTITGPGAGDVGPTANRHGRTRYGFDDSGPPWRG